MAQNQQLGTLGQVLTVNTTANTVLFASQIVIGNSTVNNTINATSVSGVPGVNTDAQYVWTNTHTFNITINGTANNTLYVGSVIAANVVSNAQLQSNVSTIQSQITSNSSAAYSNSVTYTDTKIGTANSAITANASAAYSNSVTYTDTKIGTANSAIVANASAAYTNSTVFASNASNINAGTLSEARLPYRMDQNVRTTDTITLGNLTLTGNLYVGSNVNVIGANNLSIVDNMIYLNANNTVANPDLGFAGNYNDGIYHHAGFFRDASDAGTWKVFDNYLPEPDANAYIDTTNTSFHLANFQANTLNAGNTSTNWFIANTDGAYITGTVNATSYTVGTSFTANSTVVNAVSYYAGSTLIGNTTGPYGKTESTLNVNSALTSNNSSYLGGTAAASYALSSSLSSYQTTAGLSANVATLTANNATYAFGKTEGNLNVNAASGSLSNTFTVGTAVYHVANGNVGVGNTTPGDKLVIAGNIMPGADNSYNLGNSSFRWANVFTGDLHLSNENTKGNDIDRTTGNWTVQEGETELFIINNKNGKKFKFKLEEII